MRATVGNSWAFESIDFPKRACVDLINVAIGRPAEFGSTEDFLKVAYDFDRRFHKLSFLPKFQALVGNIVPFWPPFGLNEFGVRDEFMTNGGEFSEPRCREYFVRIFHSAVEALVKILSQLG